jgi:hypothetical protein
MTLAIGDRVCIDVTAAKQLPVQGYEALLTHDIPDIWLPGTVVQALSGDRYEVDLDSTETGPARFLAHEGLIRRPRPDGSCGE